MHNSEFRQPRFDSAVSQEALFCASNFSFNEKNAAVQGTDTTPHHVKGCTGGSPIADYESSSSLIFVEEPRATATKNLIA